MPATRASDALRRFVRKTGFPCTSTLMGLGAYPANDPQFLGMLGMHGTYEANLAMHGCDVMLNVGARFDDRVTGRLNAFSPNSRKIHIDIDPSSINKNVPVEVPVVADAGRALEALIAAWDADPAVAGPPRAGGLVAADRRVARQGLPELHADPCAPGGIIKPQYAIQRLYEITRELGRETYITTEVGQHQMWAAQFFNFDQPNRWMTCGGLGTMGYGLPAGMGVQIAHPDALVIDIAGEASILMNIQEMSTLAQYRLPVKVFILNNQYMGMVRQWQELLHGGRYSESYTEALPDFVKLADSFHADGLRAHERRRAGRRDPRDAGQPARGHRRHRGGPEGKRLPDDPERRGAQRDDPRAGARAAKRSGITDEGLSGLTPRRACRPIVLRPNDMSSTNDPTYRSATISVLVENEAGVLARVVGLFSGRGYNIDSLTVAPVDDARSRSRINIVTSGTADGDRADQGAARPAGAGAPRRRPDRAGAAHRARDGADQGDRRHRRKSAPRRCGWPTRSARAWWMRRPKASFSR